MDSPDTRLSGVAAEVNIRKLDAIGLGEVCQAANGDGSDNSAKTLADKLTELTGNAWEFYFLPTHLAWANQYQEGLAVVARRGSLSMTGGRDLPYQDGLARKLAWAKVGTDRGAFLLFVTHLSISSNDQDRINEVATILDQTRQMMSLGLPMVVVGDFNSIPTTQAIHDMIAGPPAFVDSWDRKNPGQLGYTIDAANPHARIDFIFVDAASLEQIDKAHVGFTARYNGVYVSDHFGVAVEFTPSRGNFQNDRLRVHAKSP